MGSAFTLLGMRDHMYAGIFVVETTHFLQSLLPKADRDGLASRDFVRKHLESPGEFSTW